MKSIIFIACVFAILLLLTGCNIAPPPSFETSGETENKITHESPDITSEEVAATQQDDPSCYAAPLILFNATSWDSFSEDFLNDEFQKASTDCIPNDVFPAPPTIDGFHAGLFSYEEHNDLFLSSSAYWNYAIIWRRIEKSNTSFNDILFGLHYRDNIIRPSDELIFDAENDAYLSISMNGKHNYHIFLNENLYASFSMTPEGEDFESVREKLIDYALEIKALAIIPDDDSQDAPTSISFNSLSKLQDFLSVASKTPTQYENDIRSVSTDSSVEFLPHATAQKVAASIRSAEIPVISTNISSNEFRATYHIKRNEFDIVCRVNNTTYRFIYQYGITDLSENTKEPEIVDLPIGSSSIDLYWVHGVLYGAVINGNSKLTVNVYTNDKGLTFDAFDFVPINALK